MLSSLPLYNIIYIINTYLNQSVNKQKGTIKKGAPAEAFPLRGRWPAGPDEVLSSPGGEGAERSVADEVVFPRLPPMPTRPATQGGPYGIVPAFS